MAITENAPGQSNGHARFCPHCGHPAGDGPFCPGCGEPVTATAEFEQITSAVTQQQPPVMGPPPPVMGPPPPSPGPSSPSGGGSRSRMWALIAGGAVALVAVAVLAIILLNGGSSNSASQTTVYSHKLTVALSPVLAANSTLSSDLQGLSGSNTAQAKSAVAQAQSAVSQAQGALTALSAPSGSVQLTRQVTFALTQESGYLQAVQATLSTPSSGTAAQVQNAATSAQTAFVNLGALAPNGDQSISNTYALTQWANQRATAAQNHAIALAARRAAQQANSSSSGSSSSGASSSGSSSGGSSNPLGNTRDCGSNGGPEIYAGPDTSCPFALNVYSAWLAAPGMDNTVEVYSPVTGINYTMTCATAGSGETCSGGNNASVSWQ
ncbi:MAG: hypothetical protein ACLP8S_16320 [Solirubrobacteraceae bacterium]